MGCRPVSKTQRHRQDDANVLSFWQLTLITAQTHTHAHEDYIIVCMQLCVQINSNIIFIINLFVVMCRICLMIIDVFMKKTFFRSVKDEPEGRRICICFLIYYDQGHRKRRKVAQSLGFLSRQNWSILCPAVSLLFFSSVLIDANLLSETLEYYQQTIKTLIILNDNLR